MRGLDEWLPPAYLGLRLGSGYRNRLTDRAGLHNSPYIRVLTQVDAVGNVRTD